MKIKRYLVAATFGLSVLVSSLAGLGAGTAYATAGQQCQQSINNVTLSPAEPTVYHVAGWLCWQGTLSNKTVQVLVHGLTYDHNYWDWPQRPQFYSYVRKAIDAGYVTLNIDRLGDGVSDRPLDPTSLTAESHAYVVHQLIQNLRSGGFNSTPFSKIITVGHSFGSEVVKYEAATYADVNGVIITDSLHDVSPQAFTVVAPTFYPSFLDPKFASAGLAPGYLTTMPGTRGTDFYNTTYADPAVIATDETLKQTAAAGEFATLTDGDSVTQQIAVPVLLAQGQKDILFCDNTLSCADSTAVLARESSHYSPQACLEATVQPNAGHSINLHPNAHTWFEAAMTWANRRVGTGGAAPTQPCI